VGRYCTETQIRDWLKGFSLPATDYTKEIIEQYISDGEADCDQVVGRSFDFRRVIEMMNGNAYYSLMTRHRPIVILNSLVVRYYPLTVVREFKDDDQFLLINRKLGKISIRPTFALVGAFPPNFAQYYAYIFPRGENNITLDAWIGEYFIGDNFNLNKIQELGFFDVMVKSSDGSNTFFDLPRAISKPGVTDPLITTLAGVKMLKGSNFTSFVDDSANWTVKTATRVSITNANFNPTSIYRLTYIPVSVSMAAIKLSAGYLLSSKGARDDFEGSGGASSRSVSGFSESYKEGFMYGSLVENWRKEAMRELERWKKVMVIV